jgi:heat shock protein HslJ
MTRIKRLIVTGILLMISGCSLLPGSGSGLSGASWKLVSYGGNPPLPGREMTATFTAQDISGTTGCNHYFGSYQVRGAELTIENLAWTEMACMDPVGIMEQEQMLMALLEDSASYTLRADQLSITTSTGVELIFEKVQPTNP